MTQKTGDRRYRQRLARAIDPLAEVRRLVPLIQERAADAEASGRIDDEVMKALVESGTMTLMVPANLGGGEGEPSLLLDVIEELSWADGSTGWAVMASMTGLGTFTSVLPAAGAERILTSANFLMAGSVAPPGRAVRVSGGYRISGRFLIRKRRLTRRVVHRWVHPC